MRLPDAVRRTLWSCQSLVWLASWLVPSQHRKAWRTERSNAVWHWVLFLAESGDFNDENKAIVAKHCWGLFADAWWQRFEREAFLHRMNSVRVAPGTCLAVLGSWLLVGVLIGGSIASLRSLFSTPIAHPEEVYAVTVDGHGLNGRFQRVTSERLLELASIWRQSERLHGTAAYSWGPGKLGAGHNERPLVTARVAPDFFDVLGVQAAKGRTFRASDVQGCASCVLLSQELWQSHFNSDPHIIGEHITVDGAERSVIGVLPANFRLLASSIGVWTLLDGNTPHFSNFVRRVGAITRLKSSSPARVQAELTDLSENAGYRFPDAQLQLTSVQAQWRDGLRTYIFFVLLVISCAAGVVYARGVSAGIGQAPLGWRPRFRWWVFFGSKALLLLAVMFLLASSLAHFLSVRLTGSMYPVADELAVWLFLVLSIVGLSWAIHDQQKRCRICLRRLGMSVDIGRPGCVLLNWAGTELVCPAGHGVLYLPESQANWLERDRWNNFDESWEGLFRAG